MSLSQIQLRGVRVHNLRDIDLDIPHRQLVAFCGVSGSGKTSLALDTLYAEGQRRYIESFSAYTRQFLQRLGKPDAEHIAGIPPAVAVTHKDHSRSQRTTVSGATEIDDYLRLLYAKIGRIFCESCGEEIRRASPESAATQIATLPPSIKLMVAFPRFVQDATEFDALVQELREDGFVRGIAAGQIRSLEQWEFEAPGDVFPIVDRLTTDRLARERLVDSLETAFEKGGGRCLVFGSDANVARSKVELDGSPWGAFHFNRALRCESCEMEYPDPDPRLFSFTSPLGACSNCEGLGSVIDLDMELIVPETGKSLRTGAVAPWTEPAYASEQERLLKVAAKCGIPVDVPFHKLTTEQEQFVETGNPENGYGGLREFFATLEKGQQKVSVRTYLNRWRSERPCPACHGARLNPAALATRMNGRTIADVYRLKVAEALQFFRSLNLEPHEQQVARTILAQIVNRLEYLDSVGLHYLTLDRSLRTLSGGEAQRVALTSALGSSLVNMLYVLDEPSVGLHPRDVDRLIDSVVSLKDRGNTVVVVEHEEAMLRAADHIVEVGPGAGERGGQLTFTGTLSKMLSGSESLTGEYMAGRRGVGVPQHRRQPDHGWIRLAGARGHNLQNVTAEFPLGVLCLVTGVSGAGKSTLVQDTLYPALCRRKRKDATKPCPYDDVFGDGQIDDVILIDQSPIGRSPRSNPVTYVKAFDAIRAVFAETIEARTHNYTAGHFSFNVDGGRCNACKGDGFVEIDMQFLADVYMRCDRCQGTRYRKEILEVTYRGRNIADVLEMTVREAFSFFRGQAKVQEKLRRLIDVGLDYLRLGQPANTLSSGEAQRLKLAAYISSARRHRTLFIMDEPTTGLHFGDIVQLLDCFDALLSVGHSLLVVEHNLQLMKAADYIIDLGPGAAEAGGKIVVAGTPEKVARCSKSVTGKFLAEQLSAELREQSA